MSIRVKMWGRMSLQPHQHFYIDQIKYIMNIKARGKVVPKEHPVDFRRKTLLEDGFAFVLPLGGFRASLCETVLLAPEDKFLATLRRLPQSLTIRQ